MERLSGKRNRELGKKEEEIAKIISKRNSSLSFLSEEKRESLITFLAKTGKRKILLTPTE